MSKIKTIFNCQKCGYQSAKWLGRCPDCSSWNSFLEEKDCPAGIGIKERVFSAEPPVLLRDVNLQESERVRIGLKEFDRVLGGGIVTGSVTLLGGDPGIGKSTLALQVAHLLSENGLKVLYISAEESLKQTKLRALRISGELTDKLYIVSQTNLEEVIGCIENVKPQFVVIDSIQVLYNSSLGSSSGTVTQVRECAQVLTQLAKLNGFSLMLIGHVTKEGSLAGPMVLEHMVDTVLYFEGDKLSLYRILRTSKNRFGSTNEIGVFTMSSKGLEEVVNPSELFLSQRAKKSTGSVVAAVMEGTRPFLVEVQALVSRAGFNVVRRRCQGIDYNKLLLLIAVLEKRLKLPLSDKDIFVNIAGGISIDDPAVDLSVVMAIISSLKDSAIDPNIAVLGEVGLSGEIRSVSQSPLRVREAVKLGFKTVVVPVSNKKEHSSQRQPDSPLVFVENVQEAMKVVL